MCMIYLYIFYCVLGVSEIVSGYVITNSGPVVQGATIQFKVELLNDDGSSAKGRFSYIWTDIKFPENNATIDTTSPVSTWELTCDSKYKPGNYKVHLRVEKKHTMFIIQTTTEVLNKVISFTVTKTLNGELVLSQGNYTMNKYVDSSMPLNLSVSLKPSDMKFINASMNNIQSFWFIDCIYYGFVNGYNYTFNFTKTDSKHLVQALLVATNIPMNLTFGNSSASLNNGTVGNATETDVDPHKEFKEWLVTYNKTHIKGKYNFSLTDTCVNIDSIPLNNGNYAYGLFNSNFTVKDPVRVSPINGTSWLKAGEILHITVSCSGSPPYRYCFQIWPGLYNVTGKEVCERELLIKNCSFPIQHLFTRYNEYTVVVILSNSVSQVIKPIAVNIYKETKHPQLSVIIVPVVSSIVAVIIIIWGVAFYVQSKRSYTVEVADFDFANQSSDMEYKGFRERLRESVGNLFMKSNDFDDDEQVWSPSRGYGSMK